MSKLVLSLLFAGLSAAQQAPSDCTFSDKAVDASYDCDYFSLTWGIGKDDFISWNPSVGSDCSGIKVDESYCVERNYGIDSATKPTGSSPKPNVPSAGGSAIAGPSPTQPGMIDKCRSYYKAVAGDSCDSIVRNHPGALTLDDFIKWNPAVGQGCTGLWAGYYYCIAIPGMPAPQPVPKDKDPQPEKGPQPVQPGIPASCEHYHLAAAGDSCWAIAEKYHIQLEDL